MTAVLFTDTAREDLRRIAIQIAERAGDRDIAIRFVKELQDQCKILYRFPESGALPRDRVLKSGGYRFLAHKDYLIFYVYRKEEDRVYVSAVFHGRQDYMRVMGKFI